MADDEPDNLVLRELRKLRAEMQDLRAMRDELRDWRAEVQEWRGAIDSRLDRIEATGQKMWRSSIGNRTLTERGVASIAEDMGRIETDVGDLKARVSKLESAAG